MVIHRCCFVIDRVQIRVWFGETIPYNNNSKRLKFETEPLYSSLEEIMAAKTIENLAFPSVSVVYWLYHMCLCFWFCCSLENWAWNVGKMLVVRLPLILPPSNLSLGLVPRDQIITLCVKHPFFLEIWRYFSMIHERKTI